MRFRAGVNPLWFTPLTMKELTLRQKKVFEFIQREIRKKGIPPSVREIGSVFGIKSPRGVIRHLEALEKKGFIQRERIARGIKILARGIRDSEFGMIRSTLKLPILGRIAAGRPLLAEENVEGTLTLDKSFIPSGTCFCLKVKGESMIGAGILDGDFVIVRKQSTAENGEIIVALIEDEATVKRFYRERGRIRLEPENPAMEPITISEKEKEISILGKVVGVFRKI